jgi:hypothetical protein
MSIKEFYMKKAMYLLFILFSLSTISNVFSHERRSNWVRLDSLRATKITDSESISKVCEKGLFNKIKFVVENATVDIYDVVIAYEDGAVQYEHRKVTFHRGSAPYTIDLTQNNSCIQNISFTYHAPYIIGERAEITIYGGL